MEEYDFLVLGSGSGLDVANAAVQRGLAVAVVEKGPLGGTCLNRGCIPSKLLLYHAEVLETVERADEFGIEATVEDVDFAGFVREVNDSVADDSASIRRGLAASEDHELVAGEARFVDDRTVEIVAGEAEGRTLRADAVLVATGARPAVPTIDGIDDVDFLTSEEALRLQEPPEHLVIVGGGYVGAEMAHFFGTFGSEVTIVGRRPTLLPASDAEVAAEFTDRYRERFEVLVGYEGTAISEDDGQVTVEAERYDSDDASAADADAGPDPDRPERVTATGDEVLVATGRTPNTDALQPEASGVQTDDRGFVETDEYLRTTAEGVWALGDVIGERMLKHEANYEARVVARNLFDDDLRPVDYAAMPWAVFASPEVAGVGATEEELRDADREYATRTYRVEDTARGDAMKAEGTVKAIVDLDGEILGCHVVGPDASTLIEEVVVAMTGDGGHVSDVSEAVHVHPALSEVVHRAFAGQFHRPGEDGHHHRH